MACLPRSLLTVSSSLVECSLEERLQGCRRLAVESLESPRRFWLREAGLLDWVRPPDEAFVGEMRHGDVSWFAGGHSPRPSTNRNTCARACLRNGMTLRVRLGSDTGPFLTRASSGRPPRAKLDRASTVVPDAGGRVVTFGNRLFRNDTCRRSEVRNGT